METEQKLKKILGINIKTRREFKGWSQEQLAEKANVSKNTISDIETGQKFARAKTLVYLANVFGTYVYELLKPENVIPDNNNDILVKYGKDVNDAIEKVRISYLENVK